MVGGHLVTDSHDLLMRNSLVDFCVIGEGEVTAAELVSALSGQGGIGDVDGIVYREGGSLIRTAPRKPIEDLDTLPFPAWLT